MVDRRRLAAALRELREASRLTLEEAASRAIDASGAKLSRIENGKQLVSPRDVRDLCVLYAVSRSRLDELVAMAESAREPGWRESYEINDDDYVDLEADAISVRSYQMGYVPGILQVASHTRAFQTAQINSGRSAPWRDAEVDEWLEVLAARRQILEPGSGCTLSFVLDEAVLLRRVGGAQEMRAQLEHLVEVAQRPNVSLRVLPLSAGASAGQLGGFILLTMSDGQETAYVESQAGNSFIDDPSGLHRLKAVFELTTAASRDASIFIDELLTQYYRG